MPNLSPETERAIRAFAYYFEIDQKSTEFWIKQYSLSTLPKTKPTNKYPEQTKTKDESN